MTSTMKRLRPFATPLGVLAVLAALYVVPAVGIVALDARAATPAPAKLYSIPALSRANDSCQAVSDDVGFELCVIGAYALDRNVAIPAEDYSVNTRGRVVFTPAALAKLAPTPCPKG